MFFIFLICLMQFAICNFTFSQTVQQEWVRTYYSPYALSLFPQDMVIDSFGNIYETGGITTPTQNSNYFTIKYNTSGVQKWINTYNGPGSNSADLALAIAVDKRGNVYVTGYSEQYGFLTDAYCTIKYDSSGNQVWVARYKNLPYGRDDPSSIAVDNSGNVYVTGSSQSPRGFPPYIGFDYLTIKYNSNGDSLWVRRYRGPGNGNLDNFSNSICLDNLGNVYITGQSPGINAGAELCTIKYNSDGVQQWIYRKDTIQSSVGWKLAIDKITNDVYVCGSFGGGSYPQYFMVTKANTSGIQQWNNYYKVNESTAYDLVIDRTHNVYVTGIVDYINNDFYTTIKYNSNGDTLWVKNFNRLSSTSSYPKIALDKYNSVYITGHIENQNTFEFVTYKYNLDGFQQWLMTYPGGGTKVQVDYNLNIYVAGSIADSDFTTIKYSQPDGIVNINNKIPSNFFLYQNFPNPFNPITKIKFIISEEGFTTLKIYNVLGQEVAVIVNQNLKAGIYEYEWNGNNYSSGVYFYQLNTKEFVESKKLVLLK